jgi:superfamily II DNA or RNA helicase
MTRSWLDMSAAGVQPEDAERQAQSAELITRILAERPGFVLADEVGMGKTYVTFGHIALRCDQQPRLRVLVVVPSVELARKWERDLLDFCEKPSIKDRRLATRLAPQVATSTGELLNARRSGVIITTLSAIVGGLTRTPELQRTWLFEATLNRSRRHETTRRRLARRYGIAAHHRREVLNMRLFGLTFDEARPIAHKHLARCLLEDRAAEREEFDAGVRAARRELIRKRLPRYDLLVLDEAHKLKNPSSKRFRYLEQMMVGRFRTMLFLTATPFQIDLGELAAVFRLLSCANGAGQTELIDTTARVIELAQRYRQCFEQLEAAWRFCPHEAACLADDPLALDPREQVLHSAYKKALAARHALAHELAGVMLRERRATGHRRERVGSLRADLTDAEAAARGVDVRGAGRVVFAASVRLFHEMRRNRRPTFDPILLQSLTSSYEAYRHSPVLARATQGHEPFLAKLIDDLSEQAEHPKITEVVSSAVQAAAAGEKTLIFTERIETAQHLASEISEQLMRHSRALEERVENGASKRLALFINEFSNRRSSLSLAWRDNLVHTFFPFTIEQSELGRLLRRVELRPLIGAALRESALGVSAATARKRDILAAAVAVERHVLERASMSDQWRAYGLELVSQRELDHSADGELDSSGGLPRFDADDARRILLATRGFWAHAVNPRILAGLEPQLREAFVLAVRSALTRDDTTTRIGMLKAVERRRGGDRVHALERAMRSSAWEEIRSRTSRFLGLVIEHETPELRAYWIDALERTRGPVARLTGNEHESERTQRGRAFNTPFRPYVVVATSVSQEGLDLQRECSHLIHHDLSWNPASLEQRVGRIDRIHSRTARLREEGLPTTLNVGVPIIRGTIDERMWQVVRARRSWFDLCLGLEHDWESGTLDDTTPPLPESVAKELRIDLSLATPR